MLDIIARQKELARGKPETTHHTWAHTYTHIPTQPTPTRRSQGVPHI